MIGLSCLYLILILAAFPLEAAQSWGTINGKVRESLIDLPISGVVIQAVNTTFTTLSNENGEFKILHLPAGSYNIKFSKQGFKTFIKTDIMVHPGRMTYVNVRMQEQLPRITETVEVTASYFHENEKNPTSVFNISTEEIRRAPGAASDVSRTLKTFPGVATILDSNNELIVRGGCPLENGFYIDNIEFPNINHVPLLGSTGGYYSALNSNLIQNVDFFTGGFSPDYGDHLSSITEITFREGTRNEFDGQIDINWAQAGGILEGPIVKDRGSWLVSFRKSYLDLVRSLGILKKGDVDALPDTYDSQIKLTFDITPKHKMNVLYFRGAGIFDEDGHKIDTMAEYIQDTLGINWVSNWSEKFLSNTSLSYSSIKRTYGETYGIRFGGKDIWKLDDSARYLSLKNSNFFNLNNSNKFEFGFQIKHESDKLDHLICEYTDNKGNIIPQSRDNYDYHSTKYSLFFSYIGNPFPGLKSTIGCRCDYSSAHDAFHLSPRLSLTYQINNNFSLNGGFGVFYQTIPINYLAYIPEAVNVKDMKAIHYILGLQYFPGPGTKITLEAYCKEYKNLPISPDLPQTSINDWVMDLTDDNLYEPNGYKIPSRLDDDGTTAYSRGVELLIQKKLTKKFYYILSATYFRSRYKDLLGIMQNRIFDNRFLINLSGGFKPNRKWEFSGRWTLAGGAPYTPIDIEKSRQLNDWILDQSRYNRARYPTYNSLNLRIDKRWYLGKSSIIIYLDVWNVFNHKNVLYYCWGKGSKRVMPEYQLPIFPILGINYEF